MKNSKKKHVLWAKWQRENRVWDYLKIHKMSAIFDFDKFLWEVLKIVKEVIFSRKWVKKLIYKNCAHIKLHSKKNSFNWNQWPNKVKKNVTTKMWMKNSCDFLWRSYRNIFKDVKSL